MFSFFNDGLAGGNTVNSHGEVFVREKCRAQIVLLHKIIQLAKRLQSIRSANEPSTLIKSFQAFKYLPRFIREIYNTDKKLFFANILARLVTAFSPVVILWIGKLIIDEIVGIINKTGGNSNDLWTYVIIELTVVVFTDVVGRYVSLTDSLLGDLYSNQSSVLIIKKTNQLEISQLESPEFYDTLERARSQTTRRVSLMSSLLGQLESLISIITLIAGLLYFMPILILILLISIIPSFINEIKFSGQTYSLSRSWTAERRELDYLRYIGANDKTAKEIKLFGLSDFVADRFKGLSDSYYALNKSLSVRRSAFGAVFNTLGTLSYYGASVFIIYNVISGKISLGELTFLSGSFARLRGSLQGFFLGFTRISESALYLRDYFDFIDFEVPVPSKDLLPLPQKIKTGFRIENVHFSYPGSEEEILTDLSFTIGAGEKIAFVGRNGAGKTTLIKLLLRFYDPTKGVIYLDGIDISRFDKLEYQKMFGVIFQDFFRYEFTVKENIAVGKIEEIENTGRIENAALQSLASEVIDSLPMGYEQQLGKRFVKGQELSGGQWQKIALARAYMKDAEVLILDEPTAALDAKAEYEVFERFMQLTKGKCSVIISHRFSTVRMADRIIVLHSGTVAEAGSHEELMEGKGLYSELFLLQAAGYK